MTSNESLVEQVDEALIVPDPEAVERGRHFMQKIKEIMEVLKSAEDGEPAVDGGSIDFTAKKGEHLFLVPRSFPAVTFKEYMHRDGRILSDENLKHLESYEPIEVDRLSVTVPWHTSGKGGFLRAYAYSKHELVRDSVYGYEGYVAVRDVYMFPDLTSADLFIKQD